MKWLDVCGPPGSGKSTLCDPIWGPHDLPIEDKLPPAKWHDFLNEITRLFHLIGQHPTLPAAIRMNNRSVRKIATVARVESPTVYIQTALVQRGLGFGWRLNHMGIDLNELRHFFRLMPVSIGVVFTQCPEEEVVRRNHLRETVKATAHENRDFMVPLMLPAIDIAKEVLLDRGVPIAEIDTSGHPDMGRAQLRGLATQAPFDPEADGPGCQMAVLSPPPWWTR